MNDPLKELINEARAVPLKEASMSQLVEELARRQNEEHRNKEPEQWCEDCAHFKFAVTKYQATSARYNPCQRRHTMLFYMPPEWQGPDAPFGFFRAVCPDRQPRPEPVPDPPPARPNDLKPPEFRQARPPMGSKPKALK